MIRVRNLFLIVLLVSAVTGCAAIQGEEAKSTEEILAAAGFQMVPAETPKQVEMLNSLTPYKLQFSVKDNKPLYWYADPQNCKCVWTGDQAAYQRYERMQYETNLVNEEEDAAMMAEQAEFGGFGYWGWMGGPWGW